MIKAEARATKLLKEHKISEAPILVEELATKLGATLSFEPLDGNVSGMLFRDKTRTVIGVNSTHPNTRQRFTIAHEIGHLLMHEGELFVDQPFRVNHRDARSSAAVDPQEIEANAFAAELLMPRDLVERHFFGLMDKKRISIPEDLVEELSDIFKVSTQAMTIRLQKLNLMNVG